MVHNTSNNPHAAAVESLSSASEGNDRAAGLPGLGWLKRLPSGVWARVLFVFVALCLVKCAVIFSLRKELFQDVWRIPSGGNSWTDEVAFYLLAVVLGIHLWCFASRCASLGKGAGRVVFACLLVVSVAFVLLSFFEGDKSYLSALVNGVLTGGNLLSYLSLNSFFRAPYLAGWILVLGFGYYLAVRSGREAWMLRALAVVIPLYLVINLHALVRYQWQLWVLNALGLACLLAGWRGRRGVPLGLAFVPWALMGLVFLIFSGCNQNLAQPKPELMLLVSGVGTLFLGVSLIARRWGFYDAWSVFLPFASSAFLVLVVDNFHLADNYRELLVFGLGLPRYFAGEFIVAGGLLGAAVLYRRWRPQGTLLWLDLAAFGLVLIALLDMRLVQIMGMRLDWQVLSTADINSPKMLWRLVRPYLPAILLGLTAGALVYAVALRGLRHQRGTVTLMDRVAGSESWRHALSVTLLLGLAGVGLLRADKARGQAAVMLVENAPWWQRLSSEQYSREEFAGEIRGLGLDSMLVSAPASGRPRRDLNVVVIFQESVYNKHLTLFGGAEDTQPHLAAYRDRMELFPNFHSNFAGSIQARFAAFSGLHPVREYQAFTRQRVPVKSLFEILAEQGWECSIFDSSFFDYTNFRDFLRGRGVAKMYDADTMPGERKTKRVTWGLKEEETLGAIRSQIRDYAGSRKKFCLTYLPVSPHYPFDGIPKDFQKEKQQFGGDYTPSYRNELRYMDWIIAEIIGELKSSGLLDNTLVVVTSDHGEMLGDNDGFIGHGWRIKPELTNVPLIIMDPDRKGYRRNPVASSQVDLLPTIVDLLGLPLPTGQLYQGVSLYRTEAAGPRSIYLNSSLEFAVLRDGFIACGSRERDDQFSDSTFRVDELGTALTFVPVGSNHMAPDIKRFDRFQESLLRNYAHYVQMLSPAPTDLMTEAAITSSAARR